MDAKTMGLRRPQVLAARVRAALGPLEHNRRGKACSISEMYGKMRGGR